ncbi:MAG: sterol desaturase family protein [Phycisphaerales bacterium JB052]
MDLTSTTVTGCALAVCWGFESMLPAMRPGPMLSRARARHLALGMLNIIPWLAMVWAMVQVGRIPVLRDAGLLRLIDLPQWAQFVAVLLLLDFWQYACHIIMHRVPILWRLHAVHHNADLYEATTSFRFHTLEVTIQNGAMMVLLLVSGIGLDGLMVYNLLLTPVSIIHHANLRLPTHLDRILGTVLVTPGMHRVHHSRWQPETDSNYSAVFSIWDRLFRTLRSSADPYAIEPGLDGYQPHEVHTLTGMLASPFGQSRSQPGSPPKPGHRRSLHPDASSAPSGCTSATQVHKNPKDKFVDFM